MEFAALQEAFSAQELFEDKTWRLSPEPFRLTPQQHADILQIGDACLAFHNALEFLYTKSSQGKNLLRNSPLVAEWVADYLDRGKPESLREHARSKAVKGQIPRVLRPDLLWTDDGFQVTELDSVPGGIGLTGYLNQLYAKEFSESLVGDSSSMLENFYRALVAHFPRNHSPFVAIVVSDEAATYRPEMQWVAEQFQRTGRRVFVFHPEDLMPLGEAMCVDMDGNPQKVDVIYRFWELFDLPNVPIADFILEMRREQRVTVTPPMRPFQEEKLNLALFHHHLLQDFWKETLPKKAYRTLKRVIPPSWIMDPQVLPPGAVLEGPLVGGKLMHSWEQLKNASQKERNLILKISGFHENAWGARSVVLGSDCSKDEWNDAVDGAIASANDALYIVQEYKKPSRVSHPVYNETGEVYEMQGRVRLCPYYFVTDEAGSKNEIGGILATICPADKKIIHGMKDAALVPCHIEKG
ncbi:MAG: hypothetical protein AAGB06_02830 [Verrucomicrobiota bacterium]